jgi:tetratricopeptide (TPR) repeat protein
VLFNLSWACDELGDLVRARELSEQHLERARATGIPRDVAFALDLSSTYDRDEGRLDEALDAAREALQIRRDEGDVQHTLDGISRVAAIDARAGHIESAARLVSSSLHLHEERGMQVPLFMEKRNAETLELIHAGVDDASLAEAWEQGKRLTLDEAVALALEPSQSQTLQEK